MVTGVELQIRKDFVAFVLQRIYLLGRFLNRLGSLVEVPLCGFALLFAVLEVSDYLGRLAGALDAVVAVGIKFRLEVFTGGLDLLVDSVDALLNPFNLVVGFLPVEYSLGDHGEFDIRRIWRGAQLILKFGTCFLQIPLFLFECV
ncbi:hypothetical protein [Halobellus rufus]|uniref:hypothetical protein n=1 Tax=Halobellus rufus TaxID=1448860 RepID=UPI001E431816|nr:hypothetical protein [Halobellus rufus]